MPLAVMSLGGPRPVSATLSLGYLLKKKADASAAGVCEGSSMATYTLTE